MREQVEEETEYLLFSKQTGSDTQGLFWYSWKRTENDSPALRIYNIYNTSAK